MLDLYLHLIQLNTLSSILSLLTHDNNDIATSVLSAIIVGGVDGCVSDQ